MLDVSNPRAVADLLTQGKIGVLPTDTIYGIHCLAREKALVSRVFALKQRENNIPFITLILSAADLDTFDVVVNDFAKEQMQSLWPGPNTLIFDTIRGATRSFRVPKNDFLMQILQITGPLISTSANPHGLPHCVTIKQAQHYFGDAVDFYVDGGELHNAPSNIYKIEAVNLRKIR